jgi:hypothetical protein
MPGQQTTNKRGSLIGPCLGLKARHDSDDDESK